MPLTNPPASPASRTRGRRLRQRPPDRNQERREVRTARGAVEHAAVLQLADEPPLPNRTALRPRARGTTRARTRCRHSRAPPSETRTRSLRTRRTRTRPTTCPRSTLRNVSPGVSSIMSMATRAAGHPALIPSRRRDDAVDAVGGNQQRRLELAAIPRADPARDPRTRARATPPPLDHLTPASRARSSSSASNSTRRTISAAGSCDVSVMPSPDGASR